MRFPLALSAAALLFGALSARAVECKTASFEPAQLASACGKSHTDDECKAYEISFVKTCLAIKDPAEEELYKLKANPAPTPAQIARIQTLETVIADVKNTVAAVVETSKAAQQLPPGNTPLQHYGAVEKNNFNSLTNVSDLIMQPPEQYENTEEKNNDEPEKSGNNPTATPNAGSNMANTGAALENTALKGPKPDPQLLALAGKAFAGAKRPEDVQRVAQELITSAPADARGPNLAATAALMAGRPEQAADWSRRALGLDPSNREARNMLGYATSLLSKSRLKGPAQKPGFEEIGAGGPNGERPGSQSGSRSEKELSQRNAAPAAGAGTPPAYLPRHLTAAQGKAAVGDFAGAYTDLTRTLTLFPDDDAARAMRAEMALAMGNPDGALVDAEHLLAKNPKDARAMRAKASALLQLGRLDEALATIDRAILLEVLAASGHLIRAQILEKIGRAAEAAAEYREAARLDPALTPVAQEALRRLGFGPAAPAGSDKRKLLLRGVFIGIALALLLAGLLGGAAKLRTLRAQTITGTPRPDTPAK